MRTEIIQQLPGYEQTGRIFGCGGLQPAVQSRDFKDPIKVLIE